MALSKRRFVALSAVLATGSLALLIAAQPQIGEFKWWLRCIAGFFLGCVTCAVQRSLSRVRLSPAWPALALALLLVFLNLDLPGPRAELIFPISSLVVLTLALSPGGPVNAFLMLFRRLGVLSYSLYMCHALVLWGVRQACRVVLKAPEVMVDGVSTSQVTTPTGLVLIFVTVIGSLVLAWLTYQFVENPGRLWTRAWVSRREANVVVRLKRVSQ
jgi:peptidoglycan/LPS O-acetylase OafA/YrhL